MKTKYGFTQYSIQEFETYIKNLKVARTILYIQEHHTFSPDYKLCTPTNQLELQNGMKNHHVNTNGWSDIGQHFTTFPDGSIVTGRSMENSPACIYGFNSNSICIENAGNFDVDKDMMTSAQRDTIIKLTALLCLKFNIPVNTDKVVYHHWFNLSTGERNNGKGMNKSCPGTAFFGGNSVESCQKNFIPLVKSALDKMKKPQEIPVIEYRIVTANSLNIRTGPGSTNPKVQNHDPLELGAIIRVYEIKNGWCKISSSASHWVSMKFTQIVTRAKVNTDSLNVRNGPNTTYSIMGSVTKGTEIFITEERNGWSKIGMEMKWVKSSFLDKGVRGQNPS